MRAKIQGIYDEVSYKGGLQAYHDNSHDNETRKRVQTVLNGMDGTYYDAVNKILQSPIKGTNSLPRHPKIRGEIPGVLVECMAKIIKHDEEHLDCSKLIAEVVNICRKFTVDDVHTDKKSKRS